MLTRARYYGGSRDLSTAVDANIFPNVKRVTVVNPTAAGVDLTLPDARQLLVGQPVIVVNRHASNACDLRDNAGGLVATIAALKVFHGRLAANATAAGTWYGDVRSLRS